LKQTGVPKPASGVGIAPVMKKKAAMLQIAKEKEMNKNWFKFALVLVVLSALTLEACGYSKEDLTRDVRASVEESFLKNGYTVTEFSLVKKSRNEYIGVVKAVETLYINTILKDSTTVTVSLIVTVDGDSFAWKVDK